VAAAEVAADPSTWVFLLRNAVDEKLTLTDTLRSDHPQFALWLSLCATRNSLRDGRWNGVAATGQRIADQAKAPALRAEALNVTAYAQWQLGNADEALALLDTALATHPVEAHAVNAALIAAERGGRAALPYLADVMRLTARPRVRQAALERAIGLWLATDGGAGYPAALATMVRDALAVPQDDGEFHRTLLELSLTHDRVWLAGADGIATNGVPQARTAGYLTARAVYAERPSRETLRDLATALVTLRRLEPPPAWAGTELVHLVDELDRTLRAPGSAVNPAPAVAILLAADALDLRTHLTLAVRAGAYLAQAAERRGRILSVDAERRLLLRPIRLYGRSRADLGADDQPAVAATMAEHVRIAAAAAVNVAVARSGDLMDHWRRLDREPAPHYAAGRGIAARKAEILDRIDGYLRRCRPYLEAMAGLPVDEQFQRQARDTLATLAARTARARRSLA
jgi:hypothetical protein